MLYIFWPLLTRNFSPTEFSVRRKDGKAMYFLRTRLLRSSLPVTLFFFAVGPGSVVPQNLPTPQNAPSRTTQRTIVAEGDPLPILLQPRLLSQARWAWGRMVGIEQNSVNDPLLFTVRTGEPPERLRFTIPDSGHIFVYDVASGPDGSVALSGSAYTADGKHGVFIAWIAPDRKSQTVSRTWPYVPYKITFAGDGNIWAVGWILDPPSHDQNAHFNVFKVFDPSGRVLNTFTPRARTAADTSRNAVSSSHLRASQDRIGWLTNGMEYIEFALDGREVGRFEGPAFAENRTATFRSLAVSDKNDVMISVSEQRKLNIWGLDRQRHGWTPHTLGPDSEITSGQLLGFDGSFTVADVVDRKMSRTRGQGRILQTYRVSDVQ